MLKDKINITEILQPAHWKVFTLKIEHPFKG